VTEITVSIRKGRVLMFLDQFWVFPGRVRIVANTALLAGVRIRKHRIWKDRGGESVTGAAQIPFHSHEIVLEVSSMGIVTEVTLTIVDGFVNDSIFVRLALMTGETELEPNLFQELVILRIMWVMTAGTLTLCHRCVNGLSGERLQCMALDAEGTFIFLEQCWPVAAVGCVACTTVCLLEGIVDFHLFSWVSQVLVAGKAGILPFQERGIVPAVGGVTHAARTLGHRSVGVHHIDLFRKGFVAGDTKRVLFRLQ